MIGTRSAQAFERTLAQDVGSRHQLRVRRPTCRRGGCTYEAVDEEYGLCGQHRERLMRQLREAGEPTEPRAERGTQIPRSAEHESFLSTKEVAAILRCTDDHVRNLIKAGCLPAVDISVSGTGPRMGAFRIDVDDLYAFIESRKAVSA